MKGKHTHFIRRYIIAGLLVWIPLWITILVLRFIVDLLDSTMSFLPHKYQPDTLLGFHLPGLGVVISILIIFLTGMLVSNFLGRRLVHIGEAILKRIPFVRSIYMATKQVMETLFSSTSQSFRKVVLVEYPRSGLWSIAFQTGSCAGEIEQLTKETMVTVFVPTTPNPTSGYLIMVPKKDVRALDMSIDQALKFVISLGVVPPASNGNNKVVVTDNPEAKQNV